MEHLPDWIALVEEARAGDGSARSALLSRFEPLVRSTARRLVHVDRIDDVVQESYAAALQKLPELHTAAAFPSWLRLIVRKQASRQRADSTEVTLDAVVEPAAPGADPADHLARSEVSAVVRLALTSARHQDRRLLELRYLVGWTNDELAELLGVSSGAVRKRLHDARRRLRPQLEHLNPKEQPMTDYRNYLGAVHDADLDVPAAAPLRAPADEPTVTGLKVIDTMSPIRRGGTIEMTGPAGTGHVVVTLELLYRLGRTEHDVACIGVGRAGAAIGSQPDLAHIVTEPGIPGPNAAILATGPDEAGRAFEAGSRLAAGLAAEGLDVILAIDRPTLEQLDPAVLTASAGLTPEGSVTLVALNTVDRTADTPEAIGLDTTLVFSLEHLALGIFPAIDGARSTSVMGTSDAARAAKKRLADAASLRGWFNQPMYVAQDHTGEDGTWIEPDVVEAELATLSR
ncbi:MAG TPA: sigma-70 family RNA polymerase sigma factor [Acidimicrobiales bacterium]|nr:sigma-70 family RNA polymerase sigma factor [Acidimicrobiales bacterium]